jgi:hypothetical protein
MDKTKDALIGLWDNINVAHKINGKASRQLSKGAVNGIIGFINKFIKAWNKIELEVPEVKIL